MRKAALVMAAFAAFLFSVADVSAASRKKVPADKIGSKQSAVNNTSSPAFNTPNGDVAFYGHDFIMEHSPGSRFTTGNNPSSHLPTWKQQLIKLKPVATANKMKVATEAVKKLKGGGIGLAALAGSEAIMWAMEQLPGATFDPATGKPVRNHEYPDAGTYSYYSWEGHPAFYGKDPVSACLPAQWSQEYLGTHYCTNGAKLIHSTIVCPLGVKRTSNGPVCVESSTPQPFTDDDYSSLASAAASAQNSEWFRDLIRRSCEGSLAPGKCFDELTEWSKLDGPASQESETYTTTKTTRKPDGTTSTTATTSKNTYNYTYGDNYFDFSTTTTTTNNTDGQITEETETEEPPSEEEEPSEDEPSLDLGTPWDPVYEQYDDIEGQISAQPDLQAMPSFSPWFGFGGQCVPIVLQLPLIGRYEVNFCYYVEEYIRPILAFLFAVFTFSEIFLIWRNTTTVVRAS